MNANIYYPRGVYTDGSKIYIAKYKVLKSITGTVDSKIISVAYLRSQLPQELLDTSVLTLIKRKGDTLPNYYIFPNSNPKEGIASVQIDSVSHQYWEACEKGEASCKPLHFQRDNSYDYWFLIIPCGGTKTDVSLRKKGEENPIAKLSLNSAECPPIFELSNLSNGIYHGYMISCGLGGGIVIHLE